METFNDINPTFPLAIPLASDRQMLRTEIADQIKKLKEDARRKGIIPAANPQTTPKEEDLEIRLEMEQRHLEETSFTASGTGFKSCDKEMVEMSRLRHENSDATRKK